MTLTLNLSSITISVNNMAEMVLFYNNMFDTKMTPFEAYEHTFYEGKLGGLEIVFCPMEVSGIISEHTRHQLNFRTNDIKEIVAKAELIGGKQKGNLVTRNERLVVAIADPDGNTFEFIQNIETETKPAVYTRKKGEPITSRPGSKAAVAMPEPEVKPTLTEAQILLDRAESNPLITNPEEDESGTNNPDAANVQVTTSNEVLQEVVTNLEKGQKGDIEANAVESEIKPGLPVKKAGPLLTKENNPAEKVNQTEPASPYFDQDLDTDTIQPSPVMMNKFALPPAYDKNQLVMDGNLAELAGNSTLAVNHAEPEVPLKAVTLNQAVTPQVLSIHENEPVLNINDTI
jgi:predicted enzyme related to lactoylglutathione lyase